MRDMGLHTLSRVLVFENKNRTGTARLFGGWCPLTFTAIARSFHSVPSTCRADLVNIPSLKKKEESTEKKRKPNSSPTLPAHTEDERARGQGRRSQFPCPSHSHPVGGGLPTRSRHHPACRLLAGETGVGAEEGAAGGVPGGGSSPGNTVHATTRLSAWWSPESLNQVAWSSGHIMGWGTFWDLSCAAAVATLPRRN